MVPDTFSSFGAGVVEALFGDEVASKRLQMRFGEEGVCEECRE